MWKITKNIIFEHRLLSEGIISFLLTAGTMLIAGETLSNKYMLVAGIFVAIFFITHHTVEKYDKRKLKFSLFFSIPFGIAYWFGKKVTFQSTDVQPFELLDIIKILTIVTIITFSTICTLAFMENKKYIPKNKKNNGALFKNKNWLFCSMIIFACWMPLFLVFFPGLISVDSAVQIKQAIGEDSLSNWHPVLYTLLISVPTNIGYSLSNDLTIGIAMATILQMASLSLILGYIADWVGKKTSKKWISFCLLVFYALSPVVSCYSVTIWKDVLFSAIFALLFVKVYDLVDMYERESEIKFGKMLPILILSILTSFLRNGGVLIIIILGIILVFFFKKARHVIALSFVGAIIGILVIQRPIFKAFNIEGSPFMESMSIPAQQLGYLVKEDKLGEDAQQKLSKYADINCLKEQYLPMNADPAKNCFNYLAVNDDKTGLLSIWAEELPGHLTEYIKAYILHTYSYWYISSNVWVLDITHTHDETWLKTNYNDFSLLGDRAQQIVTHIEKGLTASSWFGWMNNVGVLFWGIVFAIIIILYQKRYEILIPISCVLAYMGSLLLASPVSQIFRYVYSLMLILPILIIICFINKKKGKK